MNATNMDNGSGSVILTTRTNNSQLVARGDGE